MKKKLSFVNFSTWYFYPILVSRVWKRIVLTSLLLSVLAGSMQAQKSSVNLQLKDVSITTVIDSIKKQTTFRFSYTAELEAILNEKRVTVNASNQEIVQILPLIFSSTDITYKIVEKNILLSKKKIESEQEVQGNQMVTISGYLKDSKTGETLIGATITIAELPGKGGGTNAYGYYSITIPKGNYTFVTQYVGYQESVAKIELSHSLKNDFILNESVTNLDEVVVTSEIRDKNVTKIQMGMQKLEIKEINSIPVILGEKDVLKTIQLLPGIKSAGEGGSGFCVRGGSADQNLILLDEATVYNASHLFGFFSVFNSDAIKDISVYKGTQSSEYGGRLSSVVDVKMNDGNNQKYAVSGGIGLLSSRLCVEGPIVKDKGSFIISGRRTYADLFLKLLKDSTLNQVRLYFYDFNVKANYRINDKNRIFLSGYFGKDVLGLSDVFGMDWGNTTGTLRWNHLFSDRLFSNTSFIISNYNYNININSNTSFNVVSRIQDYSLKQDFQYYGGTVSTFKFGFGTVFHQIIPGAITSSNVGLKSLANKNAWENTFYISHQYRFSDKTSVEYGSRFCIYSLLGPGEFYSYNADGETIATKSYASGEFVKTYLNVEPRLAFNYLINKQNSVKAAYCRNVQNHHLLSNSTSGNPTDLWIPSSNNVIPEVSDQFSVGYYRNFDDNKYEFSSELYYKKLQNQIDFKNGAELDFNNSAESQILFGEGRSYGLELFLKKKYGKFNGWISYTLARTERKIDTINDGNYYPAKQDKTHDISIVGIYELSKRWTLSATWVYSTGNAVTFPNGKYQVNGATKFYYTQRNGYRMPSYHRLDIGATWISKKTAKFESSWNFSLYNAYGYENASSILFRESESDASKTEAVQVTLFRFVPSITYNFKF